MPVQVTSPEQYELISGSIEAVRLLNRSGFLCPIVTVQSRIEKGIYSKSTFLDWFKTFQSDLLAEDATVLGPYLCPHSYKTNCPCHKPQPMLYLQAANDRDIDCQHSYVVGDTIDDIRAGKAIGAKTCFVQTGWASKYIPEYGHEASFVGENILAVAQWIVEDSQRIVSQ